MIEVGRPGLKLDSNGKVVVDPDATVGPDLVMVHSTESGRFLPTSRQELKEFVTAAVAGAFDGLLDEDLPRHTSASATAPCPSTLDDGDCVGEGEALVMMLIEFDDVNRRTLGKSWVVEDPAMRTHLRHLTTHLGEPMLQADQNDALQGARVAVARADGRSGS